MSYLGDIVKSVRQSGLSFRNDVYMGDDINAIDVAYSETQNHKLSVFFVPSDTKVGDGEFGRLVETRYFNAYLFVPVENDIAATDGWELATDSAASLTSTVVSLTPAGAIERIKPESSREFRVGRGYYIYMVAYAVQYVNAYPVDGKTVHYYKYTGETSGTATYTHTAINYCVTDENFALSRNVKGIYRNYGCEALLPANTGISSAINCSQKDWFIVGGTPGLSITSKSAALAAGFRVYEVNQWKSFADVGGTFVGMRIVGA